MKQITSIVTALFFSVVLMSFNGNNTKPLPTFSGNPIEVKWKTDIHNFGTIPQGKPVSVGFRFTNTGSEPLLIASANAGCGCTASDYTKEPIAAGKSSTIKVTYNAAAIGAFSKTVTVNFSDASLTKVLTVKGEVK